MSNLSKQDTVKKHVSTIHITNSLTLLQRKAFNVLLLNAYDNLLEPGKTHEVDLELFCSVLGYNSTNYPYLKKSLRELMTTVVEGDLFDETGDVKSWQAFVLLGHVELDYKSKTVSYEFPTALAKKLYNPDVFASLNLSIQGAFTSKYALALYENCVRFRGVGTTGEIELDVLKKLLGVNKKTYEQYKEFNQKIIKPAVKEVNKISDINITEIVPIKEGKFVRGLKFLFTSKNQTNLLTSSSRKDNIEQSKIFTELLERGMDEKWSLLTCASHDEKYIREKMEYADRASQNGKIDSYQGFLYNAIKNDWKDSAQEKKIEAIEKRKASLKKEAIEKKEKELEEKKSKDESLFRMARAEVFLENISPEMLEEIKNDFENTRAASAIKFGKSKVDYNKSVVKNIYHKYVYDHYLEGTEPTQQDLDSINLKINA